MHIEFLLAALHEARNGRGSCAPNPAVGAVAVKNGEIVAKAWHKGAGTPHAEQLIFSSLPAGLADVTLYVTLEPCNHWGRTPPCVDAIINYGIKRVVYAYSDPNPLVKANNTPAYLKKHGIEVIHQPVTDIDDFYRSYRYWTLTGKPWVTAKLAQSLDGKIAGELSERVQITNKGCEQFTHQQRKCTDVILTTAQTINQDNPLLTARLQEEMRSKHIAIIDRQGTLNPQSLVLASAKTCSIFHDESINIKKPLPNCVYYPVAVTDNKLDLLAVINQLGNIGFHDVWVEAGGRLFSALHQLKLVNHSYIYIAPIVLGEQAKTGYPVPYVMSKPHSINWQPIDDNMIISMIWNHEREMQPCLQD